jgi:hypothetical protein
MNSISLVLFGMHDRTLGRSSSATHTIPSVIEGGALAYLGLPPVDAEALQTHRRPGLRWIDTATHCLLPTSITGLPQS